jgi:type IV secretory pathway VirB10-like protein
MKYISLIAIIFIASYAISTRANAEDVYRCGSTYSQKPCPDAVKVDVEDSRTPAQKAEADAKTQRETAQVHAIENARQKEEAQQRAARAKLAAADAKKAAANPRTKASAPTTTKGAHSSAGKGKKKTSKTKKEPEFFVASPAADKPKAPAKGKSGK